MTCTAILDVLALAPGIHNVLVTVAGDVLYTQTSAPSTLILLSSYLQFVTLPASTSSGTTFTAIVEVLDSSGNLLPINTAVKLSFGANPGNASLTGITTVETVKGIGTFRGLGVDVGGSGYTLLASSSNIGASTSAAFNVMVPKLFPSLANVAVGTSSTGMIHLPAPATTSVRVSLVSAHPRYVSAQSSIVIAVGKTSAPFTYTGVGIGIVSLTAASVNYASYSRSLAGKPSSPTFSPSSGRYSAKQTITLTSSTPGAEIHYTTDGSKPTANSAVYSGPVELVKTQTIAPVTVAAGQVSITSVGAYVLVNK